jgi:hypothetical protein
LGRETQSPASSEAGAPGSIPLALRTGAQAPGGGRWWLWRSGQPAGASPFETRCGRRPASAGQRRFRCEASVDGRASGGSGVTLGPRGDEVRVSGRDPWHGDDRIRADPLRPHGRATVRGQRAAGTRYQLPARTDSEGKPHCGEWDGTTQNGAPSNRRARGGQPRNAVNPRVGSGMQQAHGRRNGGNRRGGVRPRGRTETSWRGCHGAEGGASFREWTFRRDVDGGARRIPGEAALV